MASSSNELNYAQIEKNFVDYILHITGPSKAQDNDRNKKMEIIKNCIKSALENESSKYNIHIFCFGSFSFKSYHQNSDIDITIVIEDKQTKKLVSPYTETFLTHVLDSIKSSISNYCREKNIEEHIEKIDSDVKLVKVNFEGVSFDISFHNFPGLFKLIFMHHLEQNYLNPYFYKRTLQLIKAFCFYEANILGSNVAALGSYALEILVIYMFNNFSDRFNSELEAFFCFFEIMNQINWEKKLLTIYGLFEQTPSFHLDGITTDPKQKIPLSKISEFIKQFERFNNIDRVQYFTNSKYLAASKSMYIIDPINPNNNLGKSVNPNNFSRIREICSFMTEKIENIKNMKKSNSFSSASEYFNVLLDIFHERVISCNSDLFRLNLPEPKIIIVTSKPNTEIKKDDDLSEISDLIQNFNKQFTVEEKEGEERGPQVEETNFNERNKLNGFLWPSNEDNLDEQTLIDYRKKNINNINYITKDIADFVNKNQQQPQEVYDFKTDKEADEIENFVKNVVISSSG